MVGKGVHGVGKEKSPLIGGLGSLLEGHGVAGIISGPGVGAEVVPVDEG